MPRHSELYSCHGRLRQVNKQAHRVGVVVIGAGQAGLSAGYHLQRSGFRPAAQDAATPATQDPTEQQTFVMLDADAAPGGAWQHRWESLRMDTVNGIFDLPGMPKPPLDPQEPSRTAVPGYFAAFEARIAELSRSAGSAKR